MSHEVCHIYKRIYPGARFFNNSLKAKLLLIAERRMMMDLDLRIFCIIMQRTAVHLTKIESWQQNLTDLFQISKNLQVAGGEVNEEYVQFRFTEEN